MNQCTSLALSDDTDQINAYINIQGKRVGYNNMIYDETEIERIARVAGKFVFIRSYMASPVLFEEF